jgi:hypothetical protein
LLIFIFLQNWENSFSWFLVETICKLRDEKINEDNIDNLKLQEENLQELKKKVINQYPVWINDILGLCPIEPNNQNQIKLSKELLMEIHNSEGKV